LICVFYSCNDVINKLCRQQPLGVFAKYTDIFSVHPPLYGYDPNMNACPVTDVTSKLGLLCVA